jgi:predicted nucleic acid-binding protein
MERWAAVSTQVLQEYFVVTTRKLGVSAQIAQDKVEIFPDSTS